MDFRHEIVNFIFHNKGIKEEEQIIIISDNLDSELATNVQLKIKRLLNKMGQENFFENVESAIDVLQWNKIIVNKNDIKIQFTGIEKDINNNIILNIDINKGGYIENYDVETL